MTRRRLEEERYHLQRAELHEKLHEKLHQEALLDAGRRRLEQLYRAIDDPSLAETMSLLYNVSPEKRRQFLFIQATYENMVLDVRTGVLTWDELIGRLRIFARNAVVAEYWDRTAEERRALPQDSLEARVGQELDVMLEELADDPEEWWITGSNRGENGWS
ncbi:DUF6082 family protein [Streptomyces canus]|uniref:DUF6082 family protein n=1 Tax=Streptomyces canus TaxID=58343 RepID=UPI002F91BAD1